MSPDAPASESTELAKARTAVAAMERALKDFANSIDILLINVDSARECVRQGNAIHAEKNLAHLREVLLKGQAAIRAAPSVTQPN